MEISATEINLLCRRISSSLPSGEYSISSIYSIEGGLLLRLRHPTLPEKMIAVSDSATWITTKNLALPEASHFISSIRDKVERQALVGVNQVGNERIARFTLEERRRGSHANLYGEFFAGGNQVLTEPENERGDGIIIDVANPQRFRHRSLVPGEVYSLPPARGVALEKVSNDLLSRLLVAGEERGGAKDEAKEGRTKSPGKVSAIKWFGRTVGTSRKFVEEIFARSGVNPDVPFEHISSKDVQALAGACADLTSELENSDSGYVLIPSGGNNELSIPSPAESPSGQSGEAVQVDVCPIVPLQWKRLEASGRATVLRFGSFGEALDEAYVQSMVYSRRKRASIEARAKSAELASAIHKQELMLEKNAFAAKELREIGAALMRQSYEEPQVTSELLEKIRILGIVEIDEQSPNASLRFVAEPRSFVSRFSGRAMASRLFDEAKRLEENNRKILLVQRELLSEKEDLESRTAEQEERAERRLNTERRAREWFERYRWFLASEGSLVVGGRDSTSNSVIINKYTESRDIVFHADLHGSPFFVLKRGGESRMEGVHTSEEVALEVAQATVSFSRAWKDELGSADAYWVHANQVKKSAPSGEYLPRGSFFVEGKKNFVKHVKVELGVGVLTSTKLKELLNSNADGRTSEDATGAASQERAASPENVRLHAIVLCGPERSISNYCFAFVRVAPGKEKASSIAKRIKQSLISKVKEDELKNISKRLTIDDIIRVLPSGNYKLVSEKQNR